jgi:mannose/fructose/N-acetylgalactosamine-specific phosphotransferase system component IID
MSKILRVARLLNWALLLLLAASVVGFLSFKNVYGLFLASVTALIAFGVFKHKAKAYFSAAAWGLAAYQLAKQGYEFQDIKRYAMILGIIVIPVALFLHEVLAKDKNRNAQKSVKNETDSRNMPQ